MKQKALIIGCYAIFILIGGIMGYMIANSLASLISSSTIALILFSCAFLIWRENVPAYNATALLVAFLFVFFSYRFFLSYKLMPGGVMALLSATLLAYLLTQRKKMSSCCCTKKSSS